LASNRTSGLGSQVRLVAIIVVLVVLIVFIALNFDRVDIDMLFATQTIRLSFALIFAALLGFLVGYFTPKGPRRTG
jgi:uncharacterized integral membrane protein